MMDVCKRILVKKQDIVGNVCAYVPDASKDKVEELQRTKESERERRRECE